MAVSFRVAIILCLLFVFCRFEDCTAGEAQFHYLNLGIKKCVHLPMMKNPCKEWWKEVRSWSNKGSTRLECVRIMQDYCDPIKVEVLPSDGRWYKSDPQVRVKVTYSVEGPPFTAEFVADKDKVRRAGL